MSDWMLLGTIAHGNILFNTVVRSDQYDYIIIN